MKTLNNYITESLKNMELPSPAQELALKLQSLLEKNDVLEKWVKATISENDLLKSAKLDKKPKEAFYRIIKAAYAVGIEPVDWVDIPSTDKWGINYDLHDKLVERWEKIIK